MSSTLAGRFLTTGPPRKSQEEHAGFNEINICWASTHVSRTNLGSETKMKRDEVPTPVCSGSMEDRSMRSVLIIYSLIHSACSLESLLCANSRDTCPGCSCMETPTQPGCTRKPHRGYFSAQYQKTSMGYPSGENVFQKGCPEEENSMWNGKSRTITETIKCSTKEIKQDPAV